VQLASVREASDVIPTVGRIKIFNLDEEPRTKAEFINHPPRERRLTMARVAA